jgi:hypothetical protein
MSNSYAVIEVAWGDVLDSQILGDINARAKLKNLHPPFTLVAIDDKRDIFVSHYDPIVRESVFGDQLLCGNKSGKIKPPVLIFLSGYRDAANPQQGEITKDSTGGLTITWTKA